jgi:uncharacterized repeat protein (TIGR01451 family)
VKDATGTGYLQNIIDISVGGEGLIAADSSGQVWFLGSRSEYISCAASDNYLPWVCGWLNDIVHVSNGWDYNGWGLDSFGQLHYWGHNSGGEGNGLKNIIQMEINDRYGGAAITIDNQVISWDRRAPVLTDVTPLTQTPTTETTANGFTDRTYELSGTDSLLGTYCLQAGPDGIAREETPTEPCGLQPGSSVTLHVKGTVPRSSVDEVIGNQSFVNTAETADIDPPAPVLPDPADIDPAGIPGNASCTADSSGTNGGWAGGMVVPGAPAQTQSELGPEDSCDQVPAFIVHKTTAAIALDKSTPTISDCSETDTNDCQVTWRVTASNTGNVTLSNMQVTERLSNELSNVRATTELRFMKVAHNDNFTLALDSSGRLWAKGDNTYGQLGDSTTTSRNDFQLVKNPAGTGTLTGVAAIAVGEHSAYAISGNRLYTWGANNRGQLGLGDNTDRSLPVMVTTSIGYIYDVAAAGEHAIVRAGNYAYAFGANDSGQLGNNTTVDSNTPVQVQQISGSALSVVIKVVTSPNNSYALLNTGVVWAWGANDYGQLGDGSYTSNLRAQSVPLSGITTIAAAGNYVLALDNTKHIYAWGENTAGQLGIGTTADSPNPVAVRGVGGSGLLGGIIEISAGADYALARNHVGKVWAWGGNTSGQLSTGNTSSSTTPLPLMQSATQAFTKIASISAASSATVIINEQGHLLSTSVNAPHYATKLTAQSVLLYDDLDPQFSHPGNNTGGTGFRILPVFNLGGNFFQGGSQQILITATVKRTLPFNNEIVVANQAWVYTDQVRRQSLGFQTTPDRPKLPSTSSVLLTEYYGIANTTSTGVNATDTCSADVDSATDADDDGRPALLGVQDLCDQTAGLIPRVIPPSLAVDKSPSTVTQCADTNITDCKVEWDVTLTNPLGAPATDVILSDRTSNSASSVVASASERFTQLSEGYWGMLALAGSGNIYQWGGMSGGLPKPTLESNLPSLAPGDKIIQVAEGVGAQYYLTEQGHLYAQGDDSHGMLGDDDPIANQSTPVAVALPSTAHIIQVEVGEFTVAALADDGTVYTWGYDGWGELGDGLPVGSPAADKHTPVTVAMPLLPAGVSIVRIDAYDHHTLALASDGSIYAWGYNLKGEIGDGSNTNRPAPVPVSMPALSPGVTIVDVAAGGNHSLALASDGAVYAWGNDSHGELGNNAALADSAIPVAVAIPALDTGVTITEITAGRESSYALASDGTVFAWGADDMEQLGDGPGTVNQPTPVSVSMPSLAHGARITNIYATVMTAFAVASDGSVYSWGGHGNGQLGDNTNSSDAPTPRTVVMPGISLTPTNSVSANNVKSGYTDRVYNLSNQVIGDAGLESSGQQVIHIEATFARSSTDTVAANQVWADAAETYIWQSPNTPNRPLIPSWNDAGSNPWGIPNTAANGSTADAVTQCTADDTSATSADIDGQTNLWVSYAVTESDSCDQVPVRILKLPTPTAALDKSVTARACTESSCTLEWDITATNTGNVALTSVKLSDRLNNQAASVVVTAAAVPLNTSNSVSDSNVKAGFTDRVYDLSTLGVVASTGLPPAGAISVHVTATVPRAVSDQVLVNQTWLSAEASGIQVSAWSAANTPNQPLAPTVFTASQNPWGVANTTTNGLTPDAITQCSADQSLAASNDIDGQPAVWVGPALAQTPSDVCDQVAAVIPAIIAPATALPFTGGLPILLMVLLIGLLLLLLGTCVARDRRMHMAGMMSAATAGAPHHIAAASHGHWVFT